MADQKNQNQGTQDSQSRTPQGKQSSQQPSSENLKNRDKNRERDEERQGMPSDLDRRKDAGDTTNEERSNVQGRNRTSTSGTERLEDEDNDELNDTNRSERL